MRYAICLALMLAFAPASEARLFDKIRERRGSAKATVVQASVTVRTAEIRATDTPAQSCSGSKCIIRR